MFGVETSGTPKDIRRTGVGRKQAGRLFDLTRGRTPVANISLIEWNRNLDKVKGDRNSNPYGVLALADRQIVVDAGANAVLRSSAARSACWPCSPRTAAQPVGPTSVAQGPDGYLYVGELAEGAGKGKARVWQVPRGRRHAGGVRHGLHADHRRGVRTGRQPVRDPVRDRTSPRTT